MQDLPTGTVTLLFTDMEGSTHLLQQVGDRYISLLAECRQLLRTAFQHWSGHEIDTQGDSFFVVFARATDAVLAVADMQRALATHPWPAGTEVRVRMGLHTGEPSLTQEGYVGLDVHRAARIMSAAHGGQVLLSQATSMLVEQDLTDDVILRDLGEHRLKDLERPQRLFQLVISNLPADFPPLKTLDASPNNLPIQPTPFIGREQELTVVRELLLRKEVRLVTLTGPGGIGKTRLALQVAAELSEHFTDGTWFVSLAPISDPDLVIPAIRQALGLREARDQSPLEQLKRSFQEKKVLLLLDNFEQVVSAAMSVADLLAGCPRLKVLVTSREGLHLRAEREFPVPALALPDTKRLPDLVALSQYAAVALFIERAQAVTPEFQVTNTNAPAVAEICVRLDGLPLAIELAAARIRLFPPQSLLTRLGQRLPLLTSSARDVPVRQQTLRKTIQWSYDLLTTHEQRLFRRLSVFVGGCTFEAIEVVCAALDKSNGAGWVLDAVASLIDKSLLQRTEQEAEEPRLVMLETVREFGRDALATTGELEAAQDAHAAYYLAFVEEAEPRLFGSKQEWWLGRLEQEHENLRVALSWLLERTHVEEGKQSAEWALRLCTALYAFWFNRAYLREGQIFLEQALALQESGAFIRAKALDAAANLAFAQGDIEQSEALSKESLALFRKQGDTLGIASCLFNLGSCARLRCQYATARAQLEEAAVLFKEAGGTWRRGQCLTELARLFTTHGAYDRANSLLEESLKIYRALGIQERIGWVLYLQAQVLFLSGGDLASAQLLAEQSLLLIKEGGNTWHFALPLALLGQIFLQRQESVRARELCEESLATVKELGGKSITDELLLSLARVLAFQGDLVRAQYLYRKSLALSRTAVYPNESLAPCLEGLAAVGVAQGELEWAARLWGTAAALREALSTPLPPVERIIYEHAVATARAQLGEQAFSAAWQEGRTMKLEQVIDDILKWGDEAGKQ